MVGRGRGSRGRSAPRSSSGETNTPRSRAIGARRAGGVLSAAVMALAVAAAPPAATAATGADPVGAASTAAVVNGDFLVRKSGHLFLLALDGTNLRPVTSGERSYVSKARFSPDGSQVAFSDDVGNLWLVNADGTNQRILRRAGALTYNSPSFSRDGSKVAFKWYGWTGNHGIGFMAARPGAAMTTVVKDGPESPYCAGGTAWPDGQYRDPGWSPVADQLAVLQNCHADYAFHEAIHILGPGGQRIGAFDRGGDRERMDFSPNGRRIVYSEYVVDDPTWLEVLDRRTGATIRFTDDRYRDIWSPAWSPDGTRIAAIFGSLSWGSGDLYTMRASDGGDRRLVLGGQYVTVMDWRAAR